MFSRFKTPVMTAALVLAACSAQSGGTAGNASAGADLAANAAAPPGATTVGQGGALVRTLTGTGLEPGFPFGMPQAEAVAAATAAFGEPSGTGRNDECGAGPMDFVSFDGLQLAFQEGRFAGWSVSGPHPSLRTASGLAVGAPRSVLGDARVAESTLGREFDVNGVGGLLDESGASVAALWAGVTCHFR